MTTEWIFGLENVGKPTEKRFRDRLWFYRYRYAVGRVAEGINERQALKIWRYIYENEITLDYHRSSRYDRFLRCLSDGLQEKDL